MKIRKLLPLLIVLALAVMLVGCASTNEPADALSPTVPAVTVPAATEPAATAPADGILNTEAPAATEAATEAPADTATDAPADTATDAPANNG